MIRESFSIADNLIADNAGDGVSFFITSHVLIHAQPSTSRSGRCERAIGSGLRDRGQYDRANGPMACRSGPTPAVRCAATRSVTTRRSGAVFGGCSTVPGNLFLHNAGDGLALTFGEDLCGGTSTVAGMSARRNAGDGIAVRGNGWPVLVERNWAPAMVMTGSTSRLPYLERRSLRFLPTAPAMRSWPREEDLHCARRRQRRSPARDLPDPEHLGTRVVAGREQIVFLDRDDIYTIRADGLDLRRLTTAGDVLHPHWSPDGTSILFVRYVPGLGHLWVMQPDGSGAAPTWARPATIRFSRRTVARSFSSTAGRAISNSGSSAPTAAIRSSLSQFARDRAGAALVSGRGSGSPTSSAWRIMGPATW